MADNPQMSTGKCDRRRHFLRNACDHWRNPMDNGHDMVLSAAAGTQNRDNVDLNQIVIAIDAK
ncbi:MAG: hypothetical protein KDE63_07990 [Novosphingobium sp.]|nr:hypothetical protein [Novosphingobium sp.]